MRAAVIVCEQPCVKGQLDYAFREDYESTSGGPALNPTWGEGTFDTSLGPYRYFEVYRKIPRTRTPFGASCLRIYCFGYGI